MRYRLGRQAVVELHRMLGFLRQADETDNRAPQPGLAELDELLAQVRTARSGVELSVRG